MERGPQFHDFLNRKTEARHLTLGVVGRGRIECAIASVADDGVAIPVNDIRCARSAHEAPSTAGAL